MLALVVRRARWKSYGGNSRRSRTQSGETALMLAKENNPAEIVELLSGGQSKTVGKA